MFFPARPDHDYELPCEHALLRRVHVFEKDDIAAVEYAIAAGRPLLMRGDPGTGKSQIALAAAHVLKRPLIPHTIDARTEPRDLFYEIDHVARLAEAQVAGAKHAACPEEIAEELKLERFIRPGPLWWAFDHDSAKGIYPASAPSAPVHAPEWTPDKGVVVLIDEIDKADADVANGLLEALGDRRFRGPKGEVIAEKVGVQGVRSVEDLREAAGRAALIIVTTNEERDLPDAFMRRCLVHTVSLPVEKKEFVSHLVRRGRAHHSSLSKTTLEEAAGALFDARTRASAAGERAPGLAEYVDLLRILDLEGRDDPERLAEILRDAQRFAYEKFKRPATSEKPR